MMQCREVQSWNDSRCLGKDKLYKCPESTVGSTAVGWLRDGAQAGTADPSEMNFLWSAKETKTWNWTKLSLGVTKRTNKMYLNYTKPTIYVNSVCYIAAGQWRESKVWKQMYQMDRNDLEWVLGRRSHWQMMTGNCSILHGQHQNLLFNP